MLRYCRYKEFSEETIKQIEKSAKHRILGLQISDKDTIDEIWTKICIVELFGSYADLSIELMGMTDSIWEVSYPVDKREFRPNIVTECEGDFEVTTENSRRTSESSILCKKRQRIAPTIRRILYSREMLTDIILNIYFSIDCWRKQDDYCEFYGGDADFSYDWKKYCKKGKDKARKKITKQEIGGEKDFVEVTYNDLPISCKIKIKNNKEPEIQSAIANVFRMFVKRPKLVDIYELGKLEKYKKIKDIYTMYKYNISEQYILEEILGDRLSYHFAEFLMKNYPEVTIHIINTEAEDSICNLFKSLLKWEGVNTRILLIHSMVGISEGEDKAELVAHKAQAEKRKVYINSRINKYNQYVDMLNDIGVGYYNDLYEDIFYTLWMKSGECLESVAIICEEYLKVNLLKDNRNSVIENNDLYYLMQKWVLNSIKEVRMSI